MTVNVPVDLRALRYSVIIRPDRYEDGTIAYIAEIPELPGCKAHGTTVDEARQNLLDAQKEYLEALAQEDLPSPSPQPAPVSTSVEWVISIEETGVAEQKSFTPSYTPVPAS